MALSIEEARIISGVLRGVSITEICSPPRITEVCRKYGLTPGMSFDIRNGFDLSDKSVQAYVEKYCDDNDPDLVVACPPCTKFSRLMDLCIAAHGLEWEKQFKIDREKAKEHIRCCLHIFRKRLKKGK